MIFEIGEEGVLDPNPWHVGILELHVGGSGIESIKDPPKVDRRIGAGQFGPVLPGDIACDKETRTDPIREAEGDLFRIGRDPLLGLKGDLEPLDFDIGGEFHVDIDLGSIGGAGPEPFEGAPPSPRLHEKPDKGGELKGARQIPRDRPGPPWVRTELELSTRHSELDDGPPSDRESVDNRETEQRHAAQPLRLLDAEKERLCPGRTDLILQDIGERRMDSHPEIEPVGEEATEWNLRCNADIGPLPVLHPDLFAIKMDVGLAKDEGDHGIRFIDQSDPRRIVVDGRPVIGNAGKRTPHRAGPSAETEVVPRADGMAPLRDKDQSDREEERQRVCFGSEHRSIYFAFYAPSWGGLAPLT